MTIPDFQTIMLPLLKYASDKKEHHIREAIEYLAKYFSLTDEEKKELLPSGQQTIFDNRTGWAKTYLKKAGLLDSPRRGYFQISESGFNVIQEDIEKIDKDFLSKYPEYISFRQRKHKVKEAQDIDTIDLKGLTPEEDNVS